MINHVINKYINKTFLIAYSGGLDSTVLLHQLLNIQKIKPQIKIRAIHINHNLSSNSKLWEKHCKIICKLHNIELIVKNINIDLNKKNIEEQLRVKRYNIIYNHLFHNEILLTGHHMNDQCETLILSLKRGSGPNGLSSMSVETIFGEKKIIRPFLKKTKIELELWANDNNLKWIEDFSNFNIEHDRNFIRHNIIPILEKRWPYFIKNCFRTARICSKETDLINHFLQEKIQHIINEDSSLNIDNFKIIKKEMCIALIRYWISLKNTKMPSYEVMHSIYQQMILSQDNANPKIILKHNELRRYKKSLYFIKTQPIIKNTVLFWHHTKKKIILPHNLGIIEKNDQGVSVPAPEQHELINIRFQHEGKILILGRDKRRKIKKIWQEKNIPSWLRNQIPLLFYNDYLISALGVFVVNIKNYNRDNWNISWNSDIKSIYYNSFVFF